MFFQLVITGLRDTGTPGGQDRFACSCLTHRSASGARPHPVRCKGKAASVPKFGRSAATTCLFVCCFHLVAHLRNPWRLGRSWSLVFWMGEPRLPRSWMLATNGLSANVSAHIHFAPEAVSMIGTNHQSFHDPSNMAA